MQVSAGLSVLAGGFRNHKRQSLELRSLYKGLEEITAMGHCNLIINVPMILLIHSFKNMYLVQSTC